MASRMTPEAALGRILGIARGVVSPDYAGREATSRTSRKRNVNRGAAKKMANGGKAKAKKKAKGMAKGGMRGGRKMMMKKGGRAAMKSKGYAKGGKMKSKGMARGGKAKR